MASLLDSSLLLDLAAQEALDPMLRPLRRSLHRVVDQHVEARLGHDLGDAAAHRPRAEHADRRDLVHRPRNCGSRFSPNAATPSAWSSVRPASSWSAGLDRQALGQRRVLRVVDEPLRQADPPRRAGGQARGQLLGRARERVGRHDRRDEAGGMGVGGAPAGARRAGSRARGACPALEPASASGRSPARGRSDGTRERIAPPRPRRPGRPRGPGSCPAPAATPLTDAITGFGRLRMASISGLYSVLMTRRNSRSALPPRRSAPAQKPRPAPVMTTARVASSLPATFTAASSSRRIVAFRAFSASGRLSVMVSTPASDSTSRVSYDWSGTARLYRRDDAKTPGASSAPGESVCGWATGVRRRACRRAC